MANVFFVHKNYLKSTFYNTVVSGGMWTGRDNVKSPDLTQVAASQDDALASTLLHFDLGESRDVRVFAIPNNIKTFNPSLSAKHRIRASNAPKWVGLSVNGTNTAEAALLNVTNGTPSPVAVAIGDTFSVRTTLGSGQVVWHTYKATAAVNIAASANGTIAVSPNLAINHTAGNVIECNMGDFTTPAYFQDWEDIYQPIYPFGTVPWGHPSLWEGKITEEERLSSPYPVVKVFDTIYTRYWLYEVDDVGNRAWNEPKLTIPYVCIGNGYQPSENSGFQGTSIGFNTATSVESTIGGRRVYGNEPVARTFAISIPSVRTNEAFTESFDIQWIGGISNEMMFIFDPEDTALMHRRAFLCTLESLNPLTFPYFDSNDTNFSLIEVL